MKGVQTIDIDTWLQVIPQLIARIDHPRRLVSRLIHDLLTAVGKQHPQVRRHVHYNYYIIGCGIHWNSVVYCRARNFRLKKISALKVFIPALMGEIFTLQILCPVLMIT